MENEDYRVVVAVRFELTTSTLSRWWSSYI